MSKEYMPQDRATARLRKLAGESRITTEDAHTGSDAFALGDLQNLFGNRAVQRLWATSTEAGLVQQDGEGTCELNEETTERIKQELSGGQPLDGALEAQASATMGHDFGGVQVHTSPEADDLNQQLNAKAFTTGQDIFFREGAYQPHSREGQELIAHELTHVVQQSTGAVSGGGGRMTVNPPGDAFEQEADAAAKAVVGSGVGPAVQRQAAEKEDELVQTQPTEEEEEALQMQPVEEEEDEEALQMQADEEEELESVA